MKRLFVFTISICLLLATAAEPEEAVPPLALHRAYFVEGPENAQPSGLTRWNGNLYTVSDKHDDWIYRVAIRDGAAALAPARRIEPPAGSESERFDFEGISHDPDGNFYLASEALCRILKVPPEGPAVWITPDLKPYGAEKGLFRVENAFLEGISLTSPGRFVLCAEREPRGLLEVDTTGASVQVTAHVLNDSKYPFARGRSPDFTGLYRYGGRLFALERNAYLVSRLERADAGFREAAGWSYRHVVTRPPYRYADMRYGKAEGLSIDERSVYIILDNNGGASDRNPKDRRPLLLMFEKPAGF